VTEEIIEEEIADRAQDYIERYDYDNAVYEYDRVLSIDPLNVDFLRDRAATQLLRGSYDQRGPRLRPVVDRPENPMRTCTTTAAVPTWPPAG
jgi:hypothetical protein